MTYGERATRPHPPARATRPSRRPVPAIAIAVAAAAVPAVIGDTAVSLIARQAGGVSSSFTPVQPAAYIALTVIGLIAGALGWYTITRVSTRPGQLLRRLVPAAIAVSFIPDIAVGVSKAEPHTTWAGVGALMVMHVIVAAAGIASYHRFLPGRRRPPPTGNHGDPSFTGNTKAALHWSPQKVMGLILSFPRRLLGS